MFQTSAFLLSFNNVKFSQTSCNRQLCGRRLRVANIETRFHKPARLSSQSTQIRATASSSSSSRTRDAALSAALLPTTVILATVLALLYPPSFGWFRSEWSSLCLAGIMLSMGLTLRKRDVAMVVSKPRRLLLGAVAQYGIMPTLAAVLARVMQLPPALALGVVLVGTCPGGAASNIVCLFAGADVAYSVLLTLTSTVLSIAATPTLVLALAGHWMPIDAIALLRSVAQMVIVPLLAGGALRAWVPHLVARVQPILPTISVLLVGAIVGSVMSASAGLVALLSPRLFVTLLLMHTLGAALGWFVGSIARVGVKKSRTLSIEVCMQNSTLASSLATIHFSDPLVAVPGAISATMHSVLGSILAGLWKLSDLAKKNKRTS